MLNFFGDRVPELRILTEKASWLFGVSAVLTTATTIILSTDVSAGPYGDLSRIFWALLGVSTALGMVFFVDGNVALLETVGSIEPHGTAYLVFGAALGLLVRRDSLFTPLCIYAFVASQVTTEKFDYENFANHCVVELELSDCCDGFGFLVPPLCSNHFGAHVLQGSCFLRSGCDCALQDPAAIQIRNGTVSFPAMRRGVEDQITSTTQPAGRNYDAAGNLMFYLTSTYTYDQENRLAATAVPSYIYDGDGDRVLNPMPAQVLQ